jgi:hypothetical protein
VTDEDVKGLLHREEVRSRRRQRVEIVALVLAGLLAVLAAGQTWRTAQVVDHQVQCQLEFNTRFIDAQRERSNSAAEERQAQRDLLVPPGGPLRTAEERQAAVNRYLDALDRADRNRAEHPLPERADCGG